MDRKCATWLLSCACTLPRAVTSCSCPYPQLCACACAGKSTLLSVLSNAKPKIADYPFTTLVPNLGVCELDFRTTVFADVPGLIVGAHRGEGLGHEFLRHVSRARALVHVLDGSSADPVGDFAAIREELALAGAGALADKPYVVAYNKVDVPDSGDYAEDVREELTARWGVAEENFVAVSAATSTGVVDLVRSACAIICVLVLAHHPPGCLL